MICVDLARHNPAHILVVDDGTTNRDILTWPHLFLEPPALTGHQAVGAAGFESRAYGEPNRPKVAARIPAASARSPANSGSKTPPGA